jgi:benzoylformate decarboxylase
MRRMTPLEAVFEILRSEGVERVFGNPGTTELPFLQALAGRADLRYVLGLHEGSVVSMADGYARATGRPSFVNLHVAAGVANGLLGMLNASRSRTPMVITAGQQDRRHLFSDPMLSGDLTGLAAPATKSAIEVQHAYDLPLALRRAFAVATQPPAGPVFVSLPMDLLDEQVDLRVEDRSPRVLPGAAAGIDEVAARLIAAERPAIVAGDGVGRERGVGALVRVAAALGAAVYHQPMYDGINFPTDHPQYCGMLAPVASGIREALDGHDVVLLVGVHAFMAHHYTAGPFIPDGTEVVQIDSDAAEIGRNFAVRVGIVGAIAPTLAALASAVDGRVADVASRAACVADRTRRARDATAAEAAAGRTTAPLSPLTAVAAIAGSLPGDAIVVEEAITAGLQLRRVLRQARPGSYVHTVGGALGWGIGAAIGTRMGSGDRPVVAVLGDGCATFGLQGLWSAAHHGVPVVFAVINNGEYRTLKQTMASGGAAVGQHVGLDLHPPHLDWAAAGRLFGIATARIDSAAQLAEVVGDVAALDGPLLVDVPVTGYEEDNDVAAAR